MVTTTTNLLHDIEEYFADHNVKPGAYSRLNPTGLLRRAHELIEDLEDKVHTLERKARRVEDILDDNDDT